MKIKYCIIIVLLVFLLISIIVSCPSAIEEIRYAREGYDEWEELSERSRQNRLYFDELIAYCKENEALYMEISEQIFDYLDEGLLEEEARVTMKDNATLEQKEILEKTPLSFPYDGNFAELSGNALYYNKGSYINIKVVYIHECSEEVEEFIASINFTNTIKINEHLYVFYTQFPYDLSMSEHNNPCKTLISKKQYCVKS